MATGLDIDFFVRHIDNENEAQPTCSEFHIRSVLAI